MTVTIESPTQCITVETLETASLGDRSYLATDGEVAIVVDPQRDIDRVLRLEARHRVRITHVVETHVQAYALPTGSGARFPHLSAHDGDVVAAGHLRLHVMHTPGHTHHHTSYALRSDDGSVHGAFTGGLDALRRHRAHRSGGRSAGADPRPVPLGAASRPGAAVGDIATLAGGAALRSYPVVDFAGLATRSEHGPILDVRREEEHARGAVPGAVHIPLHELADRLGTSRPEWCGCTAARASGPRSPRHCFERSGRMVVLVNDDYRAV